MAGYSIFAAMMTISPTLKELPYYEDSEQLFERIRHLRGAVWLDSGKPRSLQGRFDILSALPQMTLSHSTEGTVVHNSQNAQYSESEPFQAAWDLLKTQGLVDKNYAHLPFTGGLIGYFDYDLGRPLHKLSPLTKNAPLMELGWYGWAVVVNHQASRSWLVLHPACDPAIAEEVSALLNGPPPTDRSRFSLISPFAADIEPSAYQEAVAKIKAYIAAGDCYQTNYAFRHTATYQGDPWHAYKLLRRATPSPYSAFLNWNGRAVLSCSPERFLKVSVGQVEAKPIKGTIARGQTLDEDRRNAMILMNSKKDRAENLMIVDMLRNDLSRNCEANSVRVPRLFDLESFANVHHLVSTVTGTLNTEKTPLDLLRDSFPGGSITGAPKKRAMEIIDELELHPRGIYCGSIGYISSTGRMDTNIAIRTLSAENGIIECWGGGGIVADSVGESEYAEALQKVRCLMDALENPPENHDTETQTQGN